MQLESEKGKRDEETDEKPIVTRKQYCERVVDDVEKCTKLP